MSAPELGFDAPAQVGMAEADILTPSLILDLDALEANLRRMADLATAHGVALRPHGKMHKSVDVAKLQMQIGAAVGVCAQKTSEAEVFVRGGIPDVLITNQVRHPVMIDRLARLPLRGARIAVCVDDVDNIAELSAAAVRHETELGVLVEIDCGAGRCGVTTPEAAVRIAKATAAAPGLRFDGVQSYHGAAQHLTAPRDRRAAMDAALTLTRRVLTALSEAGHPARTVTGAGTGTWPVEAASGLYTELQCGSYAVMDADYGRVLDDHGARLDEGWRNALFLLTGIMSVAAAGRAVCDAGLKSVAVDSGLPVIHGRKDVTYAGASDEHGVIEDPNDSLRIGDQLRLIPGHCDPTVNLHDWLIGVRGGVVETVWPVSARGKSL